MFKKEPHIKALSNLKNSERKKLLQTCKKQTNNDEYTFPTSTIKQTNFCSQKSVGVVYTDENNTPILFKEKHNEQLFPTVYSCWENPTLLPIILTHGFVIEEHLFNGANLMISGSIPPFDPRSKVGTLCGVASREAPKVVLAIGIVEMDLPSYDRVLGETGVAVKVIHHFNDGLSKALKVKLDPPIAKSGDEDINSKQDQPPEGATIVENAQGNMQKAQVHVEELAEVLDHFSVSDVDYFITRALYYTLTQDKSLVLPISPSNFISNHIMRNLPPIDHNEVNVKKTSWRKSAKFLKHFEKEGFLKLKGKGDDLTIVGKTIDKDELKNFVPYKVGSSTSAQESGEHANSKEKTPGMMYSMTLYKPFSIAKDFLKEANLGFRTYYTSQDIRSALSQYISANNLADTKDKGKVVMDDLLFNMVNKKKKNLNAARIMPRAQILDPLLANNFTEFYQIFKNDDSLLFKAPIKGSPPRIKITTEMKIGRKVITRVSNFEVFQIDPESLAGDLRKICSGSTTIGESQTFKSAEVQVQGPHGQLIIDHLNNLGVPNKWIDFENKLKKKKRT
ncbi:Tma64p [Saccharomyces cerevisiae x Saccharomyces kudriavzevii VIN7]|uniref:Tma64p n=1 Tax=Saccharomyces cerevisiae x Saccharomyces kudriavzevii (strain VIN7) TaxID=1095631 RepID=H0GSR2_SACCK|nr:Tma64p [Saccharomyces cerevisiae x Saccharomyces kudriavzevii VIN7]